MTKSEMVESQYHSMPGARTVVLGGSTVGEHRVGRYSTRKGISAASTFGSVALRYCCNRGGKKGCATGRIAKPPSNERRAMAVLAAAMV